MPFVFNKLRDKTYLRSSFDSPSYNLLCASFFFFSKRDSLVVVVTGLWIEKSRSCGSILDKPRNAPLVQNVQTDSGTHSASNSVVSGGSFPLGTAVGSSRWRMTSILCRDQEYVDLHPYRILLLRGVHWSDFASALLFFSSLLPSLWMSVI